MTQEELKNIVIEIMDTREYHNCPYVPEFVGDHQYSDHSDCGNWDTCIPDCPYRKLMDYVGIKPKEDGNCQ